MIQECGWAKFREANFTCADLTGVFFGNTDLRGACFLGANLTSAFLSNADLSGADMTNACPEQAADLDRAKMHGVIGLDDAQRAACGLSLTTKTTQKVLPSHLTKIARCWRDGEADRAVERSDVAGGLSQERVQSLERRLLVCVPAQGHQGFQGGGREELVDGGCALPHLGEERRKEQQGFQGSQPAIRLLSMSSGLEHR